MESDTLPVAPKRRWAGVLGVAGLVLVLVGAGLGAFLLVHGTADTLGDAVPANSTFYISASISPSATQAKNLNALIAKFPIANGKDANSLINDALDAALKPKGASHSDVRSWLGAHLAVLGGANLVRGEASKSTPDVAVIAESTNDAAADSMLTKLRGKEAGWSTSSHDGVTVNQHGKAGFYAVFNHLMVVTTTSAEIDQIIAAAHGKAARLFDDADYKSAMNGLPDDNLGSGYFNLHAIFASLKGVSTDKLPPSMRQGLDAYKGAAGVLTAQGNGLKLVGTETFDTGKLPAGQRNALKVTPHANAALSFVPPHAFGFGALEGFNTVLADLISTFATVDPAGQLGSLGLADLPGVVQGMTGDVAFEVDQKDVSDFPVDGAFLIGTNDATAMQDHLAALIKTVIGKANPGLEVHQTTSTYKGATITKFDTEATGTLEASFAIYKGMTIVGGEPAEVERAMDAKDSGADITGTAGYKEAMGSGDSGEFYVDFKAVSAALRQDLSKRDAALFDLVVAPVTDHFTELSFAAQPDHDRSNFTLFLGIR